MPRALTLRLRENLDTPDRKRCFNAQHFNEVAFRYDFGTQALSLGRDQSWKRHLVESLPNRSAPVCVDLACGTGDVTFLLAERYRGATVIGLDLSEEMLRVARQRRGLRHVQFEQGDMAALPVADASVDIVTGSYALRNAPDPQKALDEIERILRPGGVLALLDFSKPPSRVLQAAEYALLRTWGGFWGLILHGNHEVHGYIAESLKRFPNRETLRCLLEARGLSVVASRRFYLGLLEQLTVCKRPPCR